MSNSIQEQISALGNVQVIVVLKSVPVAIGAAKASAALAAAIPVVASRAITRFAEAVVMELSKCFRTSELSEDTALAMAFKARKVKSAGATWYQHAAAPTDATPPVRFFPNLGLMLGTVDQNGLDALTAHASVERILAPPVLSLIRPVAVAAARPKTATTWGIRRLKADELHKRGGYPMASFFVGLKPGWRTGSTLEGPVLSKTKLGGAHGELPDLPELRASFFLVGPGVPAGRSLGIIDMRDVAPTLAHAAGLSLPTAEGKSLLP